MVIIWLAALVAFMILEVATVGLTAIWFALGALAALLSAAFGAPLWLQILWFLVISIVALALTRPLARKYLNSRRKATNADRVLGMVAIVKEDIDNVKNTGTVSVSGKLWTARSQSGVFIPRDTLVRPVSIEGVKLIVVPAEETEAVAP